MATIKDNIEEVKAVEPNKSEYVYVKIPVKDIYDNEHPGVRLNRVKFEAGKTYKVPAEIAIEVEDRLKRYEKESVRLMRPKADSTAIGDVNRGGNWSSRGSAVFGMTGGFDTLGGINETVIVVDSLL